MLADLLPLLTAAAGAAVVAVIVVISLRREGILGPGRAQGKPRGRRRGQGGVLTALQVSRRGRRRALRASLLVVLLVVMAVAAEASTLGRAVLAVQRGTTTLQEARAVLGSSPDGWTARRILAAQTLQAGAERNIAGGNRTIQTDPVVRFLGGFPLLAPTVSGLKALSASTDAAARALGDYVSIARAVDTSRGSPAPAGQRLLNLLAEVQGPAAHADRLLAAAATNLQGAQSYQPSGPVGRNLQSALDVIQPLRDQAHVLAVAAQFSPTALGASRPATYLVLLPNPTELRPSGGFSGAIGSLTLSAGTPTALSVRNQDDFNPLMKQRQAVPVALGRYLKFYKNGLELGDAGWDPDFPSTAHLSEAMYESATKQPVDGTISVDPYALEAMLAVTGPVDVAPYGHFDSGNFLVKLNRIVNVENTPTAGKAALSPIARAVLGQVLNLPAARWPNLLTVFRDQADQRHVQAFFHDRALASAAAAVHYDGALVGQGSDYLMLADANVGATKGDYYVRKSMRVLTELHPTQGVALHQVDITYDMPVATSDEDRALNPGDGSYRDYLRLLLPKEAAVASVRVTGSGAPVNGGLDTITIADDRQTVGAFVRVPRGQSVTVRVVYEVPMFAPRGYALYLQKQAGVTGLPTRVEVSYPGAVVRRTLAMTSDQVLQYTW